jgi:hypothetical protein
MAKPQFFDYPTFKETKLAKIRLAHWKPVTLYTKYRWLVQALVVVSFVIVPYFHWLKLDFTNQRYWLARVPRSRWARRISRRCARPRAATT